MALDGAGDLAGEAAAVVGIVEPDVIDRPARVRHHAAALAHAGWTVDYVRLDDPDNSGSFTGEIARAVQRHAPDRIAVTEAGEWRVV
ncbi:MAG: hypothetical protein EOP67_37730, partial [Sphingomonas sp.]